jgi:guanylate kinase
MEESLDLRLKTVRDLEYAKQASSRDKVIVNDDLKRAYSGLEAFPLRVDLKF